MSILSLDALQRIKQQQQLQQPNQNYIPLYVNNPHLKNVFQQTPITASSEQKPPQQPTKPKKQPPTDDETKELQFIAKKKTIPKHVKTLVWNKYIGADKAKAHCMSCRQADISIRSFHCGHVIAEAKGGDMTINNLRPICSDCNLAMGTMSMNEFTSQFFGWQI
jgi:5-methylcytosine-specific restriction endonuclease McrA